MGPSLTRRGLAVLAGRADRDPVVLGRADRVDLVVLDLDRGRAGPVVLDPALVVRDPVVLDRVDPRRADLADPADIRHRVNLAVLGRVGRVDPRGRADRVGPAHLVLAGRVDLLDQGMDRADRVGPAHLDLAGRADLLDQGMDRAGPVVLDRVDPRRADLADPADIRRRVDLAGRVGPAHLDLGGQVDRVDRRRRSTHPGALTSGVAPRWAAPGMCLKASARPATVRRLRRHNTDGAGMAGLRRERRRLGGTDRRPRVDGAVLRLPVVGTVHGTGRRAISQSRRPISGRSITTGTTRSRCSIRFSVDGASGSSGSGFRCTDKIQHSPPPDRSAMSPEAATC
jgi:hypothetical protein